MGIGFPLLEAGLWAERRSARAGGPALFLDRDGVVVEEVHYLRRVEDVRLTESAAETIRTMNRRNISVVLVTNQAGVGRGLFDWAAFEAVQNRMHDLLAGQGASLDAVYACAYHPDAQPPYAIAAHPWRKPGPGMLLAAATDLALDLGNSWIVGDRASDLEAGRRAGLRGGALVETGYGAQQVEINAAAALRSASFETLQTPRLGVFNPNPDTLGDRR